MGYITMKILVILAICLTSSLAYPNLQIIGGHDATKGQYPYQVSFQGCITGICEHICGGTILNERWVLTAAHCIKDWPPIMYQQRVLLGSLSVYFPDEAAVIIEVANYTIHPKYDKKEIISPYNIALLRLAENIVFNTSIQAAKLPSTDSQQSGEVVLTGWGTIANPPNEFTPPIKPLYLQTVNVPFMDWENCTQNVRSLVDGRYTLDKARNICTGSLTSGITVCSGDEGGPLTQNGVVIGVVSWGATPCGLVGAPSVYTKTIAFIDWIDSVIKN